MPVDLSDKSTALCALHYELISVQDQQLKLGEKMAEVIYEQVVLAEKSRQLTQAIDRLLK